MLRILALVAVLCAALGLAGTMPAQAETPGVYEFRSITLYLPQGVIAERLPETRVLADYILALSAKADATFVATERKHGVSGALVVVVKPGKRSRAWVVTGRPALPAAFVTALEEALGEVAAPETSGIVAFGLIFDGWGGGAPPTTGRGLEMPLPDSWVEALGPDGAFLDDKLILKVWPD
jgi:hypothetical protein